MVYWGIVLFGYDTYVPPLSLRPLYALTAPPRSGIGGGVVSQDYFKTHFGLVNPDGSANKHKSDNVSSNVVSVLQAGAFFGAIGSAPISGEPSIPSLCSASLPFSALECVAHGGRSGLVRLARLGEMVRAPARTLRRASPSQAA